MTTKLTLSIEKAIIEKAKSYAKKTERSLSEIIENYLKYLTQDNSKNEKIHPKLKKIIGSVKLPENFDEKKELSAYFAKKHL